MINLIFLLLTIFGLVFLYFQMKNNKEQRHLIENERKSLKNLRKHNSGKRENIEFL